MATTKSRSFAPPPHHDTWSRARPGGRALCPPASAPRKRGSIFHTVDSRLRGFFQSPLGANPGLTERQPRCTMDVGQGGFGGW